MMTIKQFIEFCEHIAAVPCGMADMVRIPSVSENDEICDDLLTRNEATEMLEFLGKYEYATNRHVTLLLLWKTGMRLSGLRALDKGDFDEGRPTLELRHRPTEGTPLKNKERSERDMLITPEVADVVRSYIDMNRKGVTDDHGREPLLTSKSRRIVETTILAVRLHGDPSLLLQRRELPVRPRTRDLRGYVLERLVQVSRLGQPARPTSGLRHGGTERGTVQGRDRRASQGKALDKHYDKGTSADKAERRREYIRDI